MSALGGGDVFTVDATTWHVCTAVQADSVEISTDQHRGPQAPIQHLELTPGQRCRVCLPSDLQQRAATTEQQAHAARKEHAGTVHAVVAWMLRRVFPHTTTVQIDMSDYDPNDPYGEPVVLTAVHRPKTGWRAVEPADLAMEQRDEIEKTLSEALDFGTQEATLRTIGWYRVPTHQRVTALYGDIREITLPPGV